MAGSLLGNLKPTGGIAAERTHGISSLTEISARSSPREFSWIYPEAPPRMDLGSLFPDTEASTARVDWLKAEEESDQKIAEVNRQVTEATKGLKTAIEEVVGRATEPAKDFAKHLVTEFSRSLGFFIGTEAVAFSAEEGLHCLQPAIPLPIVSKKTADIATGDRGGTR